MTFDEWWELHGSKLALPNERLMARMAWQAAIGECAKVCDNNHWEDHRMFAAAIRARSEKNDLMRSLNEAWERDPDQ